MKNRSRFLWCAVVIVFTTVWPTLARAQSESAGVNQYFNNCASCHESTDPGHQAPTTGVLKQMTPEHVLDVLTSGSMRPNAAALSDQDKRLIAEWVGGRKIDADAVGSIEKMTNVCSTHSPVRESNAPAWNGWGADLRNTRSQTAAAAGLTPAQVSRLQLKWAFGFPGAPALYSQTVFDGRLYVTSNAGYVYSLDAESGCVHWAFRAQAAVRSGFTIGRLSRTNSRLAVFFGDIRGTAYAVDASTGAVIWKTLTDPHPLARITGTPALYGYMTDACTFPLHPSKNPRPDRGTMPAAHSEDLSLHWTPARAAKFGRPTPFRKQRRSSAKTRWAKTCSRRRALACG